MEHTAVRSRDLAIVGYESEQELLEIAFRGGGVYRYEKVPQKIYQELMNADSHGTYFNQNIKDQYPSTKIR